MYQYKATLSRVIDGDTVVMDVDLGFYIVMHDIHFRLWGINCPEKNEYEGWKAATDFTANFFKEYPTTIVSVRGQDKYGRWLAEFPDPSGAGTLNMQLTKMGLAVPYFV